MKPRNKFEKAVAEINATLSEDIAVRNFERAKKDCVKWNMGTDSFSRTQVAYFGVHTNIKEWEVKRLYRLYKHKSRTTTHFIAVEIMRVFFNGTDKVYFSKRRTMGCYYDCFSFTSDIELRACYRNWAGNSLEDMEDFAWKSYPECKGERIKCDRNNPNEILRVIRNNSVAETLHKQGHPLFSWLLFNSLEFNKKLCRAYTIAKRHGFDFSHENVPIWYDMTSSIIKCNYDWRNPFYVCPKDLFATHDRFVNMRNRVIQQNQLLSDYADVDAMVADGRANEAYIKRRKRFFAMVLTDGLIECKVLPDVQAFREEGMSMEHCVYKCKYFTKPYSLVLSARINDVRVETIEVDLTNYTIKQCYGKKDHFTMYHQRILDLVNANMDTIKQYNTKRVRAKVAV